MDSDPLAIMDKSQFIKIIFNRQTKRLLGHALNLNDLGETALRKFPALSLLLDSEKNKRKQTLVIFEVNSRRKIESNKDLLNARQYCRKNGKTLTLEFENIDNCKEEEEVEQVEGKLVACRNFVLDEAGQPEHQASLSSIND